MDSRVRYKVGLELSEVHVEGTIKSAKRTQSNALKSKKYRFSEEKNRKRPTTQQSGSRTQPFMAMIKKIYSDSRKIRSKVSTKVQLCTRSFMTVKKKII